MNREINKFTKLISAETPGAKVIVDPPVEPSGHWFIDITSGKAQLTIEYRPKLGFGIHDQTALLADGPTETYRTADLAARRVIQLLRKKSRTGRLTLKELREIYECSQVDLASKVGVKQSAISRFEQRNEVKLGTLAAAIKALGGELEIRAHFPDADVPLSVKD